MSDVAILLKTSEKDFINIGNEIMVLNVNGRVAQRITRLPTEQKIAGSNPAAVKYFFNCCKRFAKWCYEFFIF